MAKAADAPRETIRLDKWLWFARFFKTRSLAARFVDSGRVRINRQPVSKSAAQVGPGDVLTFPMGERVRVIQVLNIGLRRGPATEAQALYLDLELPPAQDVLPPAEVRE